MSITRRELLILIALFAITRAALTLLGAVTVATVPSVEGPEYTHLLDGGPALDMWYRQDAGFYTSIATFGYDWFNERQPAADLAFLPLYPASIRAASTLIGMNESTCWISPYLSTCTTVGGLIISNVALLIATLFLFDLTKRRFSATIGFGAAVLLMITPNAIFLSGVYSESLFLLLCVLTFWLIDRGHFGWALLPAALACLTRSVGVALFPALVYVAWTSAPELRVRRLIATLILPLVYGGWILFAGLVAGDPLAYFSTYQSTWGRASSSPIDALLAYFDGREQVALLGWRLSWIDLAATVGYLILGVLTLRLNRAWGLFALSAVIIPVATGALLSMPRFGAVIFPFYVLIAGWAADRWWKRGLVYAISAALLFLFVTRFVTWRWIA